MRLLIEEPEISELLLSMSTIGNDSDEMEEKVDECSGLILLQDVRKPSGFRGIRSTVAELYSSSSKKNGPSARLLESSSGEKFEDVDLTQLQKHPQRNKFNFRRFVPSLRSFIIGAFFFILGIAVACGLSLGFPNYGSLLQVFDKPDTPAFNAFGVPNNLPVVPITDLINKNELDLQTNFVISGTPTIREYEFNISHALAAPDGFYKPMILANGQSPGPLIEVNTGDTIRVKVNNLMPNTTTSIHFHGLNQGNTTWMDGVAGVSQCGIPADGGSWTYEFTVEDQRGTFWWHAHTAVQFSDGLYGPIVVHDPEELVDPQDTQEVGGGGERVLFLGENYHAFAAELAEVYLSPSSPWDPTEAGVEPLSDNLLLNGQNTFDCAVTSTTFASAQLQQANTPSCTGGQAYTTTIQPGSTLRLRLINHSAYLSYWFSIDGHNLTIVEMDGIEVEPIASTGVHVNIGQRYSLLIKADQAVGEYIIRSTLERECFLPFSTYNSSGLEAIGYQARGKLIYEGAGAGEGEGEGEATNKRGEGKEVVAAAAREVNNNDNTTNPNPWGCYDMPFSIPVPRRAEAAYELSDTDPQHIVDFQFRQVGEVNRIFLNRTSWAPYEHNATLWQAVEQDFTKSGDGGSYHNWGFRLDQQVLLVPDGSQAVQVAINSLDVMEHPFHMQ